jgi:murein DD-endopeptidase MepM/ murein hydrolase activator NlpD
MPAAVEQFYALRTTAMTSAASVGINSMSSDDMREASTHDWMGVAAVPTLWPVQGRVTASYGERIDPFSGEGAFHRGIDIASEIGTRIVAPADGVVKFSDLINGYGRAVIIDHGNGISTLYGHLSGFAVSAGQLIHRGDTLGYVGQSGRSTGPHLHYEVRVLNTPVNPYKYLRFTLSQQVALGAM